jgi:serine/threonine protein kinase
MQQQELQMGAVVADYRIESFLGRGGQGIVYLAEHIHLGRKVAFKVLPPELVGDDSFRRRFLREARLAASLDHPNILDVYDAGEADGRLYLAVRLVRGSDLGVVISQDGPLSLERTVWIVRHVADALDAAHDAGLVHRDVKPGNILLDAPEGRRTTEHVYLADFGLTKPLTPQPDGSGIGSLTMPGYFVGTPDYAAPEQIEGKDLDARIDIYSLGCVLYQCLAGEVPFPRDSLASSIVAHMTEPPPTVSPRRPDVPAAIDDVITRAMAKRPQDRFQSCEEMAAALLEASRPFQAPAAPASFHPTPLMEGTPPATPRPTMDSPPPVAASPPVALTPPAHAGAPVTPTTTPSGPVPPGAPAPTDVPPPPPERPPRRMWLLVGIPILAVVVIVATVVLVTRGGSPGVTPTGPDLAASSCGPVKQIAAFGPGRQDTVHIGESGFPTGPPLSDYPSQPPASGPHDGQTVAAGFYDKPPNIYRAIHSLEHAAVIVWYADSEAGSSALNQIKTQMAGADHVVVAPYVYPGPGGQLPNGVAMALTAWHKQQVCGQLSPSTVQEFVKKFRFVPQHPRAYQGQAPETDTPI